MSPIKLLIYIAIGVAVSAMLFLVVRQYLFNVAKAATEVAVRG